MNSFFVFKFYDRDLINIQSITLNKTVKQMVLYLKKIISIAKYTNRF